MSNMKIAYELAITTEKIKDILDQVDTVKALTLSLIAAIECKVYEDFSGEKEASKGTEHFVFSEKALLEVFGETLNEHFSRLTDRIERAFSNDTD